ncbi:MAG: glycosyltransferase family 2 protein [Bifidobacteriaceae bacterium]|jgi:glycosyltransferase involved in cell wall biosynthesis|nr:glycosyltransferase family 2 protein [Bifidobacteriaceae bacterium]
MPATGFDDVWVVIPVYNEAAVFASVLADVTGTFGHVCVVDDCSTDGSAAIAQEFAGRGVRLVRHPFNLGQGAALQTGLEYVLGDPLMRRVITFDADGQHHVADAVAMVERLDASGATPAGPAGQASSRPGLDVVLGSRFLGGGKGEMGGAKRLVLKAAIAYTNLVVGMKLTDTHNGLRAMNRRAVAALHITQNGMAHATEILEQVKRANLAYVEHKVKISYSPYAKAKGQSLLNAINILVDLVLR